MTGRYSREIDRALSALITEATGGRPAMTRRTWPGRTPAEDFTVTAPADPLEGLRAVAGLERAIRERARDYARYAREDGGSWEQVGAALDCAPDPAETAFLLVASDLGSGPVFPWTCPSCRGRVLDHGPGAGHPAEQERGHAEGCARLAETVRAWDAQQEDDGDD